MTRSHSLGHLSDQLREFAARRLAEVLGLATLASCGALTLALVSWSARDPSFNHATDGKIRNLLGAPGAVVADLLMQLVGVATIAAILPLALLGWRLLTRRAIGRLGLRLTLWFVGVAFAAATAALLPVTDRWPLPTGLGGVIGDAMLALPRHATNSSALFMALAGAISLVVAILTLTGAAGMGFETVSALREQSRQSMRTTNSERDDDEDDADDEPGVALARWARSFTPG